VALALSLSLALSPTAQVIAGANVQALENTIKDNL
jgi:hypothetical protein